MSSPGRHSLRGWILRLVRLTTGLGPWRCSRRSLPGGALILFVSWVLACFAAAPAPAAPAPVASAAPVPATAVKAVFLYRFAGYVQWPSAPSGPFTIAVIGAPDVAAQLAQLLPDHRIQGRPAQVKAIERPGELQDAQILYIGPGYRGNLRALIAPLADRPVLVVTDASGGLAAGGTVNFLIEQQHVRFEVSTAAAQRAGLKISSDLLAVAVRVQTGGLIPLPGRTLAGSSARHHRGVRGPAGDAPGTV